MGVERPSAYEVKVEVMRFAQEVIDLRSRTLVILLPQALAYIIYIRTQKERRIIAFLTSLNCGPEKTFEQRYSVQQSHAYA